MKNKKSNILWVIILLLILGIVYYYQEDLSNFFIKKYIIDNELLIASSNTYTKGIDYLGFQQTDNFKPSNKEELKNIFFTMLDKGWDEFSFYPDESYTNYVNDIQTMTNDGTFSAINNYVHPFNSYKLINVSINKLGIINIKITKNYSEEEIILINNKIDEIINKIITKNMSDIEKIKAFHDYIINNTVYDIEEAKLVDQKKSENVLSYKATNVVLNGIGLCGGYTDSLAIFLNKIGVNNIKVSTDKHIWNAVLIDNTWKHIDMTWDDPVTSNNAQILIYNYFMISTKELRSLDQIKHNYDNNYYLEVK